MGLGKEREGEARLTRKGVDERERDGTFISRTRDRVADPSKDDHERSIA